MLGGENKKPASANRRARLVLRDSDCELIAQLDGRFAAGGPAQADWWSDNNPLHDLTPNWGPLIPNPKNFGERNPMCLGSPQNCAVKPGPAVNLPTLPQLGVGQSPAYIYRRYICRNASTGQINGGCTSKVQAATCDQAEAMLQESFYGRLHGDPCRYCVKSTVDNTSTYAGRFEDQQAGICRR